MAVDGSDTDLDLLPGASGLCGALNRNNEPCRRMPVPGGLRCRFHGGRSLRGPAAPAWRHGRYSQYLPTNVIDRYQSMRNDPDVLCLHDEVAMLQSRTAELLEEVKAMESAGSVSAIAKAYFALRNAFESGAENQKLLNLFDSLRNAIHNGRRKKEVWNEVRASLTIQRRLIAEQRKTEDVMTPEQAAALGSALIAVVQRVIHKYAEAEADHIMREIADEMTALLHRPEVAA